MLSVSLPDAFQDLDPLVTGGWALPTERERNSKRYASTMEELQEVYDAILPRLDDMIAYLNSLPIDDMPEDAKRLFYLTLTLAEISLAVERFKQPTVPNGFDTDRFKPFAPVGELT